MTIVTVEMEMKFLFKIWAIYMKQEMMDTPLMDLRTDGHKINRYLNVPLVIQ